MYSRRCSVRQLRSALQFGLNGRALLLLVLVSAVLVLTRAPALSQEPPAVTTADLAADPLLSSYAHASKQVDIGGRTIDLRCTGKGNETVVLDAWLGDFSVEWYKVEPAVAQRAKVCSFDRAGFGFSQDSPAPQSVYDVATDLHKALASAGIKPPYVLVGHSIGGLEVRLFAARWPQEVSGMVLVDTSFYGQKKALSELPGYDAEFYQKTSDGQQHCISAASGFLLPSGASEYSKCVPKPPIGSPSSLLEMWPHLWRRNSFENLVSLGNSSDDPRSAVADSFNLESKPLIVITAGLRPDFQDNVKYRDAFKKIWPDRHERLARLSSKSRHVFVDDLNHNIVYQRPSVVIDAIEEVLDDIQK